MLIDFHTHAFPEKIVDRAISSLSKTAGGVIPSYDGRVDSLISLMDKNGVDKSVVLNIATNVRQMHSVNDFASSINSDRIVAFGSVHPDAPDVLEELDRIKSLGLKGIKFHPEYQNFFVDDEKMQPIYEKISSLNLITVFHSGGDLGYLPPYHCMPDNALNALKWFSSPVVFAHWGGYFYSDEVLDKLAGSDAYFDVSYGYNSVPRPLAQEIVKKHGADKLLFGSDGPWHQPDKEKLFIESLDLTQEDNEKIFYKNAQKLLNL